MKGCCKVFQVFAKGEPGAPDAVVASGFSLPLLRCPWLAHGIIRHTPDNQILCSSRTTGQEFISVLPTSFARSARAVQWLVIVKRHLAPAPFAKHPPGFWRRDGSHSLPGFAGHALTNHRHLLFAAPLFSWSYELLFPQPLSFQNYLRCPRSVGGALPRNVPCSPLCSLRRRLPRPGRGGKSISFKHLRTLCLSLCSPKKSTPLPSTKSRLFDKNTRGGVFRADLRDARPGCTLGALEPSPSRIQE
jgi:hypothetical protein